MFVCVRDCDIKNILNKKEHNKLKMKELKRSRGREIERKSAKTELSYRKAATTN